MPVSPEREEYECGERCDLGDVVKERGKTTLLEAWKRRPWDPDCDVDNTSKDGIVHTVDGLYAWTRE